jgi:hypothetical protein
VRDYGKSFVDRFFDADLFNLALDLCERRR